MESAVEVVENKKTGQVFVFIEEGSGINLKLINPSGGEVEVPSILFGQRRKVAAVELSGILTPEQLKAAESWSSKPTRKRKAGTTTRTRKAATKKKTKKIGLGAEWTCEHLTFYKHRIEPLDEGQWFIVRVDGEGSYKLTKDQFSNEFMDVILHENYWRNGSFSYQQIPDKIKKYLMTDQDGHQT